MLLFRQKHHSSKKRLRSLRRETVTFPETAFACLGDFGLVSPDQEILTQC